MRTLERSRILQIHPTRRCNLRCLHCYSSSGPEERGELPASLLRGAFVEAAAEGYTVASFSGGEPLLYRPLPDLLAHAQQLGMLTTVTSNGMLLDAGKLDTLRGVVDLLAISLDGTPESHNTMRGHARAFATMASRLAAVRQSGIPFGFIFTLTQYNLHEVEWVMDFALDNGASLLQIHPLELAGRALERLTGDRPDATEAAYAFLLATELQKKCGERMQVQLDLVSQRAFESRPDCFCAAVDPGGPFADLVSPLVIEADGTVVPLEYGFARRLALGNLHEAGLGELARRWRSAQWPSFRQLCRVTASGLARQEATPLANWYEAVREASAATPA